MVGFDGAALWLLHVSGRQRDIERETETQRDRDTERQSQRDTHTETHVYCEGRYRPIRIKIEREGF